MKSEHEHLPGLDTLRSFAIITVMLSHLPFIFGKNFLGENLKEIFRYGWIGVDLFFVLSGFLIGSQVLAELKSTDNINLRNFYIKRIFRILPPYFVVLAIYYAWPPFRERPEIDQPIRFLLFYMNYGRNGEAFSHAWSLCIEEHFYLVFPLALFFAARYVKKINPTYLIGFLLLFEIGIRLYLHFDHALYYPQIYRKTHTHLDGLVLGVTLSFIKTFHPKTWSSLLKYPKTFFSSGFAFVVFSLLILPTFGEAWEWPLQFLLLALGFSCLVLSANTQNFWLGRKKIPGATIIATLAYTLYLTHKQMYHLAKLIVEKPGEHKLMTVALILILVTFAALTLHYFIEKPALSLRKKVLSSFKTRVHEIFS